VASSTTVSHVNPYLKPTQKGKKKKRKSNKKKKKRKALGRQQTIPLRVALAKLFHDERYPEGEIVEYTIFDTPRLKNFVVYPL